MKTLLFGSVLFCLLGQLPEMAIDNCFPETKRGIATVNKSPPERVETLEIEGGEGLRIIAAITEEFNLMEDQASSKITYSYGMGKRRVEYMVPWGDAATRRNIPLEEERLYRLQGDGFTAYYVEARREYAVPEKVFFPTNSFLKAWVVEVNGELVWIFQDVEIQGLDTKTTQHDTPIAFWSCRNGIDVLVRREWWESEDCLIIKVTPNGISDSLFMQP